MPSTLLILKTPASNRSPLNQKTPSPPARGLRGEWMGLDVVKSLWNYFWVLSEQTARPLKACLATKSNDSNDEISDSVKEQLEEGGVGEVLTGAPDGKYTPRQKITLFVGAILFLAIIAMPVPQTFVDTAITLVVTDKDLVNEAASLGFVTINKGKIDKVLKTQEFLDWIKGKDEKLYKNIMKKASDMKAVAALAILMAVWWIGESIPLPATALLPLAILPLLGVQKITAVAPNYASKIIFLFMGGFMIAAAMTRWNLHKRLALLIVNAIGTSPRKIILGFMIASAFLSMWISNTATTMMMMPIGLAIILHVATLGQQMQKEGKFKNVDFRAGQFKFGAALMLGIAYAASIGGVSTIIGTPPNAIVVGTLPKLFPGAPQITFVDWLALGIPISWITLFLAWFLMVYVINPPEIDTLPGGKEIIEGELKKLGPWSKGEKIVLAVFILTALAWIFSKPKNIAGVEIPGIKMWLPMVDDYVIAMIAAISLFLIPVDFKKGVFALDWEHASKIPWGILLLFGGGIALSKAFTTSGLAVWMGHQLIFLKGMPPIIVLLAIVVLVIFLTEITSNTAITTLMMPIMAAFAIALGEDPRAFMISAAVAASYTFMLPVATPPNAIVFGTGYVTIPQMARTGFLLNLVGIVIVTIFCYFLVPAVFGVQWGVVPDWVNQ